MSEKTIWRNFFTPDVTEFQSSVQPMVTNELKSDPEKLRWYQAIRQQAESK